MDERTKKELLRIGRAITAVRVESLNLSQEKLAELANIDRTYMSRIERGCQNVSVQILNRVARALQLKPSELLARAGL